jgi:X-X-X-Leu-X-X-Gly heptad repeat protein
MTDWTALSAQQATTKLLVRAALVALPAAIAVLLFGPFGLILALLLFGAALFLPPLTGRSLGGVLAALPAGGLGLLGVILLLLVLGPFLVVLPGLVFGLVVIALALLVVLGWMGAGPLATPMLALRLMLRLAFLLPSLAEGLRQVAKAATAAASAGEKVADGLGTAADRVGDLRAGLAALQVPTLSASPAWNDVALPGGGSVPVPGWAITTGTLNPVPEMATDALDAAQQAIRGARDRLDDQQTAIAKISDALDAMADLVEGR